METPTNESASTTNGFTKSLKVIGVLAALSIGGCISRNVYTHYQNNVNSPVYIAYQEAHRTGQTQLDYVMAIHFDGIRPPDDWHRGEWELYKANHPEKAKAYLRKTLKPSKIRKSWAFCQALLGDWDEYAFYESLVGQYVERLIAITSDMLRTTTIREGETIPDPELMTKHLELIFNSQFSNSVWNEDVYNIFANLPESLRADVSEQWFITIKALEKNWHKQVEKDRAKAVQSNNN